MFMGICPKTNKTHGESNPNTSCLSILYLLLLFLLLCPIQPSSLLCQDRVKSTPNNQSALKLVFSLPFTPSGFVLSCKSQGAHTSTLHGIKNTTNQDNSY
ncbi:hypothetical protein FKM82_027551 [Ascaphus truei]